MFGNIAATAAKLAVVMSINISLFMIVPASQSFLDMIKNEKKEVVVKRRTVAQLIRPKEVKKQATPKSRLRTVSSGSSEPMQNPMKFKFSPNLSVAGGGDGASIATQELSAEVFDEDEVDERATPKFTPAPSYPEKAKKLAIEGTVKIEFTVGTDGRVQTIDNIDAPHPSFNKEIRNTLQKWKFTPAKNKGIPVKSRQRIALNFFLDK